MGDQNCSVGNISNMTIIGSFVCSNAGGSTVIGNYSCVEAARGIGIGQLANVISGTDSISIGTAAKNCGGDYGIAIGYFATNWCGGSGVIGNNSNSCHNGSYVIGNSIDTERTDTVHVNHLLALGQAASKKYAIGSTGGTVTFNLNDGNVQTLSLTSSISSLTKSNPIDGGIYTFEITQAGTGSYTIAWGTDVKWPDGTPPTLSTAVGAIDYVTLVYTGTNFYGNANYIFS